MRLSPLRHPLAVLRVMVGLSQHEFGRMVGRSARTIQAVELLQMALSPGLAEEMGRQTGVDAAWLLLGDPAVPARSAVELAPFKVGDPYTRDLFESYRGSGQWQNSSINDIKRWDRSLTEQFEKLLQLPPNCPEGLRVRSTIAQLFRKLNGESKAALNLLASDPGI